MSFNLNKNNSPEDSGNLKKPNNTSKFDLSKNEIQTEETQKKSSKSLVVLFLILAIGAIAFFIFNQKNNSTEFEKIVTDEKVDQKPATIYEGENVLQNSESKVSHLPSTETSTPISEQLNNKIPASFNSGSTDLKNIDKDLISKIIEYLNANKNASLTINGYASSEGILFKNIEISQARADALKNHLIKSGVTENRIVSVGKGIENPIASNDNEKGREKNRRVEINFN